MFGAVGAVWLSLALVFVPASAQTRTLRYASAFDPQSMDPHALALLYQTRVVAQVYEGLVNRDPHFRLEPALATTWQMVSPTAWRFTLREGVRFHDGSAFTADDAVFSIQRALERTSQRANQLRGITGARKVDAVTIEVTSSAYFCRYVAKQVVASGFAKKAEIQVGYAIGMAKPVSVKVDTFGTGDERAAADFVMNAFDFRPRAIIEKLDLLRPIYRQTTNYGHFGRPGLPWETVEKAAAVAK
jgi:peptide/nickel transport system substrate-binding protein